VRLALGTSTENSVRARTPETEIELQKLTDEGFEVFNNCRKRAPSRPCKGKPPDGGKVQ